MDKLSDEEKSTYQDPIPQHFDEYLPWACAQLRIDANVIVTKIQSVERNGSNKLKKANAMKSKQDIAESKVSVSFDDRKYTFVSHPYNTVKICAGYDTFGNLLQLKFNKNKKVPKQLFKLIGLFIHFHKFMTRITINSGLDNECLYELKKLIILSNITDLCLDNTALHDGYYDILLEDNNKLKQLSMSRCKIDDNIVKRIAMNLKYTPPASKTLLTLNLASNLITDIGAKHLAVALRTNRQLVYLNLADNKMTDEGAEEIFNALTVFLVTGEEVLSFRHRKVQYIKESNSLVNQIAQELKAADFERRYSKRKSVKPTNVAPTVPYKKGNERDFVKNAGDRSIADLDALWLEKAKIIAKDRMGEFIEPFSAEYAYVEDGQLYCRGNNRLAYINISYNNIGYITVKKILAVLLTQKAQNATPKGLVNVSLEGNCIPAKCRELEQIDLILLSNIHGNKKSITTKSKK